MKFRFAILLSVALIASRMVYCVAGESTQYRGFSTQQEAAEAFLQFVAAGDFSGSLSVFDCGLAASMFTFSNKVARIGSIHPVVTIPTEYAGFVELNLIQLRSGAASQLRSFIYNLLLPAGKYDDFLSGKPIVFRKESQAEMLQAAEDFSRSVDPARLEGLKLLHLDTALSSMQKDDDESLIESMSKLQQKRIEAEGFEGVADCVMYFSWNGGVYASGVIFTQYADEWHINSLASHIGGIAHGQVKKLDATPDEFERAMEIDLIHLLK